MYFNGKTFFNQETNMRVVANQRNPPVRRKGVKKKKIKKKGEKINLKKLKSLFGNDAIVSLLFTLIDKQSRGPNMKSQGRKELGEGKVRKMRQARGGGLPTGKQTKIDRDKKEKRERIDRASIKKPGETNEDVSLRLMKEVIGGDNPAVAAFLQANQIPAELRKLQGNLAVLGEAYFDSKTTAKDKKLIERNILQQVIEGVGGEVRKEFLTSIEEKEAVSGIIQAVEMLKKETGIEDPEKLIARKGEITKKINKRLEKGKITEEDAIIALDGLDIVEELKTADKKEIEAIITDADISNIESKKKAGGRAKQSPEQIRKNLTEYIERENPNLQVDVDNRQYFLDFIDTEIDKGLKKSAIQKKLDTKLKKLAEGKLSIDPPKPKAEKKTRADAGIFAEGAIANKPDAYNITIGSTGERKLFDLYEANRRARFVRDELEKYDNRLPTDLITSKNKKSFEKELEGHRVEFRNQLKAKAEGLDYKLKPDYTQQTFTPDEIADDINDLVKDFSLKGIGLPDFKLYKGESIYGYGEEGITLKNSVDNTYRYIDYKQTDFRKELDRIRKEEASAQKALRKAGITSSTEQTTTEKLIEGLPDDLQDKYSRGELTGSDLNRIPPRLQLDYKDYVKQLNKAKKASKTQEGQLVVAGSTDDPSASPGFFKKLFGSKAYTPKVEREAETLGFTKSGKEITDQTLKAGGEAIAKASQSKKLSKEEIQQLPYDERKEYEQEQQKLQQAAQAGFEDLFSGLDTFGDKGDLLDKPPTPKKQGILSREDFDTDDDFFQYQQQLPVFGSQEQGQGFQIDTPQFTTTTPVSEIEKSVKEERAEIIKRYKDGAKLEPSEIRKLTKPDRKKIGLLTEQEYTTLSEKEKTRYDAIKANIESIAETRQQVGDYSFLGTIKLPNDMLEQFRIAAITPVVENEPQVEAPPPVGNPPPKKRRGRPPKSSQQSVSNIDELITQGNNKPSNLGEAISAALGGGVSEAEKERKKKALKLLDEQQRELLRETTPKKPLKQRLQEDLQQKADELGISVDKLVKQEQKKLKKTNKAQSAEERQASSGINQLLANLQEEVGAGELGEIIEDIDEVYDEGVGGGGEQDYLLEDD